MDLYAYDDAIRQEGFEVIAGVDEAGRGPLAGPVVAAAVILPRECPLKGIRDSKTVPEKEREHLYEEISRVALAFGIGIIGTEEIDRINILEATRHAMLAAIAGLGSAMDIVLIDALSLPSLPGPQRPIIKGDAQSASIAAASLLAKVHRDRLMREYHSLYPQYGFDRHKGYATKAHCAALREYGPSPLHRKSFQRVLSLPLPFAVE
ncbi:MAG: ribonuclease HII [Alphaproteobacteria bacterium]|uniref:Ribonuclease HII n=1 Tax=Candidatus Nitrobium versatile TaxID=2884831 RepID=A0A953M1C9_9BACT|nr:ribonuclease HII [Candidatus Nitrobium versatile]